MMAFGDVKGTLTGNAASITNPFAITGSVAVVVGDLVYAVFGEQANLTATTVTDNLGHTYTQTNVGTDGGTVTCHAYWIVATTAGTLTSISAVATASSDNVAGVGAVYEGPFLPSASQPDANPSDDTTDITSPFTCPATGTLSPGTSNQELIVAWAVSNGSSVWTANAPNILDAQQASANVISARLGHQVVTATTTVVPEFAGINPSNVVLGTTSFKSNTQKPPILGPSDTRNFQPMVAQ